MEHVDLRKSEVEEYVSSISILGPVLGVMNELLEHRLLEDYVIGGGVAVLYEEVVVNLEMLEPILARYNLIKRWERLQDVE